MGHTVTLLTQDACALCDQAKEVVGRVAQDHPLALEEIRLDSERGRQRAQTACRARRACRRAGYRGRTAP